MAAIVRSDHDLPTLRVHISRPGREELVAILEVMRGRGEPTQVARVPTLTLGLADEIGSARDVSEARFALDTAVVRRVADALHGLAAEDVPAFWLELPPPRGYLQLVPWEPLLSPTLRRPLLRLPNFTLRPQAPGPSLRIIL